MRSLKFPESVSHEDIARLIAGTFRDRRDKQYNLQSFFTTQSQEFLRYLLDALKENGLSG